MGLKGPKRACKRAAGGLSAANCGSFASAESLNGRNGRLRPGFKGYFPFWLEYFCGGVFVGIIRHRPASCGGGRERQALTKEQTGGMGETRNAPLFAKEGVHLNRY